MRLQLDSQTPGGRTVDPYRVKQTIMRSTAPTQLKLFSELRSADQQETQSSSPAGGAERELSKWRKMRQSPPPALVSIG
jgi:hypothetical protein